MLNYIPFIIYLLFAMHIFWFGAAGAWLIYSHREQHDNSRLYVAFSFLYMGLGCIIFIATGIFRGDLNGFIYTILEPYPLMISFLPVLAFPLYVVEIMQSQWITKKRLLLLISPWLAICAAWLIYHGMHDWHYHAITHLSHANEIIPNLHKTDVLLRALLAAIYFPYVFALLFVRYNWRTTNVNSNKLWILKGLIVLLYFGFIIGMVLRIHGVMFAYFIVLDVLSVYIIVIETTARIPVPQTEPIQPVPQSASNTASALSPLAQSLQQQLTLGIWQNPDLDRDDLCQLLGTNRTYLSLGIQELGFTNLHDMLNKQRVVYMHDELLKDPKAPLSDVIYRAGFRNRTIAANVFKQIYHCKPSEFINR